MKKIATLSFFGFLLLAISSYFLFNNSSSQKRTFIATVTDLEPVLGEEKRVPKNEELKARIEQEVRMTRDLALGYIPKERLIEAERYATLLTKNVRENNPQALLPWVERGPNNVAGRARAILVDAADVTDNTVYIGSVSGGLWKTTNFLNAGGPTWTQIGTVSANLAITCLAQDPTNPLVMYAGTGEGYNNIDAVRGLGIYKTSDGGATWSLLASTTTGGASANDFSVVQDIVVYSNGNVYASGISYVFCNAGGVLRSINGGASWTRVVGALTGMTCADAHDFQAYDLEISPSGDIYATVQDYGPLYGGGNPEGKIFRTDAGVTVGNVGTWTNITPAPQPGEFWQRIDLAIAPSDNNRVYAAFQGTGSGIDTILRSDNRGTAWLDVFNIPNWCDGGTIRQKDFSRNQAFYDLIVAVKPNDPNTVFVGGVDFFKTTDGGTTWLQNTAWAGGCGGQPNIHADIHNMIYTTNNDAIVVTDGGIYFTNNGVSYSPKFNGFNTVQYYANAIHPTSGSNYQLGGTQDNGTHKFSVAGLGAITSARGGDGGFCFIDQDDPTTQIVSNTGASYVVSRNSGTNFNVNASFPNAEQFINPADYDDASGILFASYSAGLMLRVSNIPSGSVLGQTLAFAPATDRVISAARVDPNTANRVWLAWTTAPSAMTNQTVQLYYVDDANSGSPTITQVTVPALSAGANISSIDVETGDANHLLLTVSNYGQNSVWESTNLGASWTSVEGNLPDMPVRWGMFVPSTTSPGSGTNAIGGVMLATELGVWSTQSLSGGTTNWIQNSTGVGNVRTDMLQYRANDRTVSAATHGRGMFTATLFLALPVDFVSFNGEKGQRSNNLYWRVENEVNNKGFEVERKYNNEAGFTKIGFVPSQPNPRQANDYSFTDGLVDLGKTNASYRLRQIDLDGKFKYSSIVALSRDASRKFVEYVSVTHGKVLIRINGGSQDNLSLRLYDDAGRLVKNSRVFNQTQHLDISNLPRGVYVLDLLHPDGNQRFTQKIVY